MKPIIHHLLSALLALFVLAGCYDDGKVWDAIGDHQQRLDALESWQKTVSGNIEALQVLLSGQDYVTGITPVTLGGDTVGYTIAFDAHAPVTLYNGATGEQGARGEQGIAGATPAISVTRRDDGNWYWTLNGETITDDGGNPLRANGTDGQPGSGAPAPMLKTGAQLAAEGIPPSAGNLPDWTPGAVYLSVDAGATWAQVSGTPGNDNDLLFKSVDLYEEYIDLTLNNDDVITVPRYVELGFDLAIVDKNNDLIPVNNLNDTILCHYDNLKLKCTFRGTEGISSDVYVMARMIPNPGDWRVDTKQLSRTEYYIELRCSSVHPSVLFTLLIIVTDNAGHSCTYDLSIQQTYD